MRWRSGRPSLGLAVRSLKARGIPPPPTGHRQVYDRKRFLDGGLRHHELYFPDGSCPSNEIMLRFLEIAETVSNAKAGPWRRPRRGPPCRRRPGRSRFKGLRRSGAGGASSL